MPETSDHAGAAATEPTRLDQSQPSLVENLYRAAIGPGRATYYLPILSRFEAHGRASPSWNWAACAGTLNWMLFRGLWLAAVLYLAALAAAALALAGGIALADPPVPESLQWGLWAALLTLALLIPGFFGNAWLYRVYRRRLDTALAATASLNEATMLLARQSSSRPRWLALALANGVLAAMLAAWWWPSDLHRQPRTRASDGVGALIEPNTGAAPGPASPASASGTPQAPNTGAAPGHASPASASGTPHAPNTGAAPGHAGPASASRTPQAPNAGSVVPQTVPAPPTRVAPAASAAPPPGPYRINVGLFAQQDNAARAHARLQQAGLPATSEALSTAGGQRTRVRVGPFATRAQANAAALRVRALQLDAVVIGPQRRAQGR